MAGFGQWKKRLQDPAPAAFGVYTCSSCGRALQLELVLTAEAERLEGSATGYITFEHFCGCEPSVVHNSRVWGSHMSFMALFGTQPSLPYASPFAWQSVDEDDPAMSRWRWEVGQVADVGEFLLFLEDAAQRGAA
jgi:hypothetical protein